MQTLKYDESRLVLRPAGGFEGRGERRGDEKIFGEVFDELQRADFPQAQAFQMD
jgi:hypothetical protein